MSRRPLSSLGDFFCPLRSNWFSTLLPFPFLSLYLEKTQSIHQSINTRSFLNCSILKPLRRSTSTSCCLVFMLPTVSLWTRCSLWTRSRRRLGGFGKWPSTWSAVRGKTFACTGWILGVGSCEERLGSMRYERHPDC
jgi:hypothetical protein